MMPLDPHDAELLAKMLGMMGSDHAGERANAAAAAEAMRKKLGLTWPELLGLSQEFTPERDTARPKPTWREPRTWAEAVECAVRHDFLLNDWERRFVRDLAPKTWRGPSMRLSEKQQAKIDDIIAKVRAWHEGGD
jgi:hypothetical protein